MKTSTGIKVLGILATVLALAACGAEKHAGLSADDDEVITQHLEEIATPEELRAEILAGARPTGDSPFEDGGTIVVLDRIVNLGKQAWKFIEDNQPVVNIQYDWANALPKGVSAESDLEGFSDVQFSSYRIYGKNLYGIRVYDVTFTVVHQYGGSYEGKGAYLASVAVIPDEVSVLWGYDVDFEVSNISTTNVGTSSAPVASLTMEAIFKVETIIKKHRDTKIFQLRGDKARINANL